MLDVDPILLDAITGSHEPVWTADAWYDGQLKYRGLPVTSCSVTAQDQQVERTLDLVVVSDDPVLSPDSATSPLSPWGQEINVRAGVKTPAGPVTVSMGWFVLDSSDPMDTHITREVEGQQLTTLSGLRISLTGQDRASRVKDYRFTAPEQKPANTTFYAEVARLLKDVATVGVHRVPDATMGSIVYEGKERLDALDTLAQRRNARLTFDVDGLAVMAPRTATGDSWTIPTGGKDIVVSVSRKLTRGDFYNGVVSEGRDPATNATYIGTAIDATGPQRWGGPAGFVPYFHDSPLITSQAAADQDAVTTLENLVKKRQQDVVLRCVSNPALEMLDSVTWSGPKGTFTGVAKRIKWDHTGQMELTVSVPQADAWLLR